MSIVTIGECFIRDKQFMGLMESYFDSFVGQQASSCGGVIYQATKESLNIVNDQNPLNLVVKKMPHGVVGHPTMQVEQWVIISINGIGINPNINLSQKRGLDPKTPPLRLNIRKG